MGDLFLKLKEAGCDVDSAMKICDGIESLYVSILLKFTHKKDVELIKAAYHEKNISEVFYYSHTLKSIYLSLGLVKLSELNQPILDMSRDAEVEVLDKYPFNEWIEQLNQEHQKIVDIINNEIDN